MPSTNAIQKQILDGAQIRIDKQSEIPVHKQIVEQIIVLIATGRLEQGEPLPTVRQLGRQKKIHYNTVSRAYKELVAEGWLLRQSGRALKVGSLDSAEAPPRDLDGLIDLTIRLARQCGYSMEELRHRVAERFAAQPDRILILSTDSGLCRILKSELEHHVSCPIQTSHPDRLPTDPALAAGAMVVCLLGAASVLRPVLPKRCPLISLAISNVDQPLEHIRSMREPSLIALVSVSKLFLQRARGVLAPLLGSKHSLEEYLLENKNRLQLETFDLVLCDSVAFHQVKAREVFRYQLVSEESVAKIRAGLTNVKVVPTILAEALLAGLR